jgi:Tol biopolymer transport system component
MPETSGGPSGLLVLIEYDADGNRLIELDLQSLKTTTLFQAPQDGSSKPQPFMTRSDPQESFFFTAWAPDGQSIYYTHLYRMDPNSEVPAYQNDIERTDLQGERETLIDKALWPAISPDGTQLAFLYTDMATLSNDLYLANLDGTNHAPVLPPGVNPPVDAHLFSPDGRQLIFSMVDYQPAPSESWLEKLFGVEVSSAHSVPSDWFVAPVSGGAPQRLTNLGAVNLNGDLSPDGKLLAFISASGLYIMNLDGSNLTQVSDKLLVGTVSWLP